MFCSLISSTISSLCFPVRLANGGSDTNSGRVEIYHDGQWGTVCEHYFGQEEADVVCKMLGHAFGLMVTADHYGRGRGPIWLDNVNCQGHESDMADCEHLPLGERICTHYMDVGVQCFWVAMERKCSHFDENFVMAALKNCQNIVTTVLHRMLTSAGSIFYYSDKYRFFGFKVTDV